MSDDNKNGAWDANVGITLPGNIKATTSIMLSPLFFENAGFVSGSSNGSVIGRGDKFWYWSMTSVRYQTYRLYAELQIYPNDNNERFSPISLRCLVSTNNR